MGAAMMAPGRTPQQGQGRQMPPPRRGGGPGKRPPAGSPIADLQAMQQVQERQGRGKGKPRGRMASKDFVKNQMEKEIAAGNATEEDLAMEMQKYDDRMGIVGVHPNQQQAPQVQDQLTPGQIRRNKERELIKWAPANAGGRSPKRNRHSAIGQSRKNLDHLHRPELTEEQLANQMEDRRNQLSHKDRLPVPDPRGQAGGRSPKGQSRKPGAPNQMMPPQGRPMAGGRSPKRGRRPMPPRTGGRTPGPTTATMMY